MASRKNKKYMSKRKNSLLVVFLSALTLSIFFVLSTWLSIFAPKQALAATSSTINFQARLMSNAGAIVADGNYNVEFKLYNSLSSTGSSQGSCSGDAACLWTETRTSGNKVRVANGYLTVELGSVTSLPTSIDWSQNLYLSLNIGGTGTTASWDGEMSPRLHLTAVPYAFTAGQLTTLNGSNSSTLGFVQPTANRSVLVPDESGTLCIQNSVNCGFALSSGSGNYIQNSTSLQSGANFNISGTGIAATALQAPILDAAAVGGLDIGTTNANAINLKKSTTITGGITQSGGVISLAGNAASSITTSTGGLTLTAAATSTWSVGGTNQSLTITTSGTGTLTLGTGGAGTVTIGTSSATINVGTTNVAHTVHIADGGTSTTQSVTIGSTNGSSSTTIQGGTSSTAINLTAGTNGSINLTSTGTGTNLLKSATSTIVRDTSTGSATAFQIQNASSTPLFNVDTTSNGLITMGTALRLNVTSTNGDTFTTPLASSVKTAINIPLFNPGAFGQILAFGLPSTADTTARAISVFDARSSGTIQPAIALFSPNENDVFGLSWNGLNTTASLETSSAAIALRPGGTNVKLWAGSTGVAIGSNVSSASYPLDVTGDINTSTQYRIAGVVICTSLGCSPSAGSTNYIQNTTSAQSANMYVQAATSGSVAATVRANAAGTGDILDLKNGAGTNVATFGSTGSVALQNSTNSTTAFQVQNVNGDQLINVDTSNSNVTLNAGTSQLGPWKATNSLPQSLKYAGSASANGFVYTVGGYDSVYKNTVYFAQQNSDGSLGSWQTGTSLPVSLLAASVVISNNYIYVVGGQTSSSRVATVYYATINPTTGVVGSWTTSANSLPTATAWGSAAVANGYLYYAGGYNGTASTTAVYYSALNAGTGANGAFTTSPNSLPAGRDSGAMTVLNNYLYYSGGVNGTPANSSVFYAPINPSTGAVSSAWTTATNSLPAVRTFQGMVASNGVLYVVGGQDNSTTQSTVYYAKQGTNGAPGVWGAGSSLPAATTAAAVSIATNGYVYVVGGANGTNVSYSYYASTQNMTSVGGNLTASGSLSIQSSTDAANTLQVQNSTGWQLFNVNSSDNVISLNANSPMNGTSSQWGTASYLPSSTDGSSSVTVNGTVYYIGGYDGTNYVTDVYYSQSSGSGTLGSWKTANSLPSGRAFASAVTMNGYIYVIGGNASGTYSTAVYYAKVNADGSLGAWQTTTVLPGARAYAAAATANGYIYLVGGKSGNTTYNSTVYYAAPSASTGAISSWSTAANALPAARGQHTAVTANGYLYAMGGNDGTANATTVYYSQLNTSTGAPGAWTTSANSIPEALDDNAAVVSGGYAYIFGGYNGTDVRNTVYYAAMNSNGTTGTWQAMSKTLPENVNFGAATTANGYLYVLGGYNGNYFLNTVYAAAQQGVVAISGNTNVSGNASFISSTNSTSAFRVQNASGNALLDVDTVNNVVTLNGEVGAVLTPWQQTTSLSAATAYAGSTIMNGYAYTFGGYGSASAHTNTVQYAPINANGTMGSWTTTTALPAVRGYVTAVSGNGYVYVLGGTDNGGVNYNTIYIGKQNSDGSITSWLTSSVTLPSNLNAISAVISNGFLYVLGGTGGATSAPTTAVSYTHINSDGSLNAFNSGTALPTALANASAVVANGYVYYIGGYNGSASVSTVYYSALSPTGGNGAWNTTTSLPATASNYSATVMNGNVYYFRGSSTYYAQFNADGTIGKWTTDSNSIPNGYNGISALNYNGYIYIMGGYNGSSAGTTGVYYTSGARTMVMGSLDLVGLTTVGAVTNDAAGGVGSVGGSLTAGNTNIVGSLQVQGQSTFSQNVAINGNNLTVGNDLDDPNTGSSSITVQSRGYAGINLYGDSQNTSGEPGGAYIVYSTDGILNTSAVMGLVQGTDVDPSGTTYTGAVGNNLLVGNRSNFGLQLGTNSNVRMTIMNSGNVCIAVATCTKKLGVSGTIGASGTITASTTPDLAETIAAASDVEAADVVMADPNNTERVVKSDHSYNTAAVGVISDGTSSFMINSYGGSPDAALTGKPLVLAGRVPVKVSGANGAIKPGDYLTSSDIPGYAMKATQAGPTIGKALGYFSGDTGKVLVLVNLSYYDPATNLQSASTNFNDINVSGTATIANLKVINATVDTLTIGGHIITQGDAPQIQLMSAAGQSASATLAGNDTSGTITLTTGDQATADDLVKIMFNKAFGAAPRIVLTPVGKDSALVNGYVDQATANDFMVGVSQAPTSGKVYTFNYQIMQ